MWHFNPPQNTKFDDFVNPNSYLTNENLYVPVIHPSPLPNTSPPAYEIHSTRGAVHIPANATYVIIYNKMSSG
jgi:hypothetical protein